MLYYMVKPLYKYVFVYKTQDLTDKNNFLLLFIRVRCYEIYVWTRIFIVS